MADRYWVGGTANWDATAGTKWSSTSGGAGGASVPTSADDVFFTDLSTGTCTIATGNTGAKSINCTGFTGTLANNEINVAGSITLAAGMTYTQSGNGFNITGSGTLTTAGKTLGQININGAGITVTLGDALNATGFLILSQGTFTTNNFTVTCNGLNSNNSNVRTINLGSSTVNLTGTTPISFTTSTNLTFNAGTSTIDASSGSGTQTFNTGAGTLTFYNLIAGRTSAGLTSFTGTGLVVFNNLTIISVTVAGVRNIAFSQNATINGTLSTTGTAGNQRLWFLSNTYGVRRTLTVNSAPSLTDVDFRDIIVNGTSAPISGTRIGNRGACSGITFDAPKTVYWNLAAGGNWSANAWATASGGGVSTDNFPLAQDTATIVNTGLTSSATVTLDSAIGYVPTVNMSGRTSNMILSFGTNTTCYGSWTNGSGTALTGTGTITFSGEGTKAITSVGKTFSCAITIDAYGGTVELADALRIESNRDLNITNGTFDTKDFSVTASILSSSNSNVRTIKLGSSTLTLSGLTSFNATTSTNLTFDAGTSQINATASSNTTVDGGGLSFYNLSFTGASTGTRSISGSNTFNNLSLTARSSAGLVTLDLSANQTVTGTLTVEGASAVRRNFVRSNTIGITRTITANAISANDCDFRDITIAGTAAGASPTRAGDCGGNSGVTFPAPKTVYWNLSGSQDWSATGWAPSSGGAPAVNEFPLAQDTAVFDEAGSAGTVSINAAWNIGTLDASARTSAMTLAHGAAATFYGNYTLGSGVTISGISTQTFSGRGTQTITSAGKTITFQVTIDSFSGTFQLGDAFNSSDAIAFNTGTFDAVSYNVTFTGISSNNSNVRTLKMGSGLWTGTSTGSVWNLNSTNLTFLKGTANILLSNTTTTGRTFNGANLSYNKLTIGGATGTSTTTINGNNLFSELASTKTVAHTIALGATTQEFGAWTVTGTAGNVVTLTGTATLILVGPATSGINYLALGTTVLSNGSPGEFFAGVNSTGGTRFTLTAPPAPRTLYWVGGSGDVNNTAKWSLASGGAGGEPLPTSLDDVIFDSSSNATTYTIALPTGYSLRTKTLTMDGPATGTLNIGLGFGSFVAHGDFTIASTGVAITGQPGAFVLSGDSTLKTLVIPLTIPSPVIVYGYECNWTLGNQLIASNRFDLRVDAGTFSTGNYFMRVGHIESDTKWGRTINLGSSSIEVYDQFFASAGPIEFANPESLTFNAGTSTITYNGDEDATFACAGKTFYNVVLASSTPVSYTFNGNNTFNNLTFSGVASSGIENIVFTANQTINGTLTLSAGTDATCRNFVRSNTLGTTRTLTCNAVSATDVDFRDITIAGSAAPASGTRLGDCKGNSGITFDAAKTVYWNLAGAQNWNATGWASSSGASPAVNNFPLAQDTAIFDDAGAAGTVSITLPYNIGSFDASLRTSAITLTNTSSPTIYGNWTNGTGITPNNTGTLNFSGRGTQTITSAGKTFTQPIVIDSPSGTVQLGDAFTSSNTLTLTQGTFDAVSYNLTFTIFNSNNSNVRTLNMGSGTWTVSETTVNIWNTNTITGLTFNKGTANIVAITGTGITSRTFNGGGLVYNKLTIGGTTGSSPLTINQNNTFTEIASTKTVAHTIALGSTTQRVGAWTVTGTSGNVVTITGTTSNLIYTGVGTITGLDYLNIQGRAYGPDGEITGVWNAGANSVNSGSLGWDFTAAPPPPPAANANFFLLFA